MVQYKATLISHTHWDRAWYVTFQEFRVRLVRLIDNLLTILRTDPEFKVFMLDGQMSVLEDYLEVRPEKAAELQAWCKAGRVQVGPWFVLADEFLVSPESLIRNLQLGRRMGEPYGGVVSIGYVPDGFGHIAQLPQILRGFGIDNAFFWRGMGVDGDRLGTEFNWCAPDGSSVTTILMPWGYHNVTNLGYGIHWGDTSQMKFKPELAVQKIVRAIDKLKPMANTDALMLMNGIDHAEPEPLIAQIIAHANEELEDTVVEAGTLSDHLARVRASGVNLQDFEGEFRWGRYSEILQGVYSTRIHLKQANHAGETWLERYVEPLDALAWLSDAPILEGTSDLIRLAWHWLLLNHPHDDIYGSGIDEVHHEMAYRFSQSKQIGEVLVRDNLRLIARQVDYTAMDGMPVLVYNPLGWERSETVEAEIDFEFDDPTANNFQIVNAAHELISHQVVSDEQRFWMEVLKPSRKRRVRVLFPVHVPPCGYTTVYIQPAKADMPASNLTITARGAENHRVGFTIADDGGLTVTDKITDHSYIGLNHFYDVEDVGDEYSYCPAVNSRTISTVGNTAIIKQIESGPCRAGFSIEWQLEVPANVTPDRKSRSSETVILPICSEVYLYPDQPEIQIVTTIQNAAQDHKLTVNFPTGLQPKQAFVDAAFMVAARDLKLPDSTGWVEDPTPLMHQRTFTDLSIDGHGLALLNRGLPSVEVTEDGMIALTLLRAVGWLSRDDLSVRRVAAGPLVPTPGAQCLGEYRYEYAILPHDGDWLQVYPIAHNYNAPLLARRANTHPGLELREMNITRDNPSLVTSIEWPRAGNLPDTHSFIRFDSPKLVLSAVYRSGTNLIVRCYNMTREVVKASLLVGVDIAVAWRVNMAEEELMRLSITDKCRLEIEVRGAEVYTLKLTPFSKSTEL